LILCSIVVHLAVSARDVHDRRFRFIIFGGWPFDPD